MSFIIVIARFIPFFQQSVSTDVKTRNFLVIIKLVFFAHVQ